MQGTCLGPYRILAELGSGGMGRVYRAELARPAAGLEAGAVVALKVIHAHLLEQEAFFRRYVREADIGRAVRHENVVRTYVAEALQHEGERQDFLVMEFVEGQTLRDLLAELDRLPEELCCHIGREIAKGLAAIHEAGVVHRDLKPENVLITADHVVKVMDLGVARLQEEALRLSRDGTFVGSLEYAAPEQFLKAGGPPDPRTDLHALGVLLYELATGRHPYRADEVSQVIRNILEEKPRKPGEVNPQLSAFFEEVVLTLLAKERADRFGSAAELVAVLEEGEESAWWQGRARALRLATKRPLRRVRVPRETALHGRDRELARLQALYEQAAAGEGRAVLVEGEAGIGKSRLVDEFVSRLREAGEDVEFLFGSYPPGGAATAAGAFSEAYREQFGPEGLEEALAACLADTPSLVPAFAAVLRGTPVPDGAPVLTKESLQTVFVQASRWLAARRTTIILIDDLHFAPADGRGLFSSLAMAVPGHRLLLVGAMRPGVPETWVADLERLDHASHVVLPRLGPKDLASLLRDAFRSERLAHELGWKIALKSDGNPFFTFEIIRGLREGRFLRRMPDGTWITTQVIEDVQVPSSVVDIIQARLGDLEDEERNLLEVAACCGFTFDPLLVGSVLGLAAVPTLQHLGRIEKRYRLVRAQGRRFAFDHHEVQHTLYRGLSDLLRERYHAALGEALEAQAPSEAANGDRHVDLCVHFLKGGHGDRALPHLAPAMRHLAAGFLNDQAVALADRALAVPGLLKGTARLDVLVDKVERLGFLAQTAAQEPALAEARELAEATEDPVRRARVEKLAGDLALMKGRYHELEAAGRRLSAFARENRSREAESTALVSMGLAALHQGRAEAAYGHLARALEIARDLGDVELEPPAVGNLASACQELGRFVEAEAHRHRHLAVTRELGDLRGEAAATGNLGVLYHQLGRHAPARGQYERALELCRRIGDRQGESIGLRSLGRLDTDRGRYGEACEKLQRARDIAGEIGNPHLRAASSIALGRVLALLGRREPAARMLEEGIGLARGIGAPSPLDEGLAALAALADEAGHRDRALDLAMEALDVRRGMDEPAGTAEALVQVGDLRARCGDASGARAALDEAVDLLREHLPGSRHLARAQALRARYLGADPGEALAVLEEAGETADGPEVRLPLYEATGNPAHLEAAWRFLEERIRHAPVEDRETMVEHVRLHRSICDAGSGRRHEA